MKKLTEDHNLQGGLVPAYSTPSACSSLGRSVKYRPAIQTVNFLNLFFMSHNSYIMFTSTDFASKYKVFSKLDNFIIPEPNSGCWLWTGYRNKCGYGIFYHNKLRLAHRFIYEQLYGKIPAGKVICHKCDTPSCVNPEHLFLGTQKENIIQAVMRGRWQKSGKYCGRQKITPDKVRFIRKSNLRQVDLAKMFNVSRACINLIKKGKRQSWVREISK